MEKEISLKDQLNLPEVIQDDMQIIEGKLLQSVQSDNPVMQDIINRSVSSGGKRLRPMLIMSTFRALNGKNTEMAYYGATALELIHSASLIHDDIIDHATHRRGVSTAFETYGLSPALLAGDFLFVEGYGLASNLPYHIVQSVVVSLKRLGEGQLSEEMLGSGDQTFEQYQSIIRDKTAYLFWGSCRMGSQLAESDEITVENLSHAGMALGMAFQYIDDILDIIGDITITGKPAGTDYFTNKMTLPYFLYQDKFGKLPEERNSVTFSSVLPKLQSDAVLKPAKEMARKYTEQALSIFKQLPDNNITRFLIQLGTQMQDRVN